MASQRSIQTSQVFQYINPQPIQFQERGLAHRGGSPKSFESSELLVTTAAGGAHDWPGNGRVL